MNPGMNKSNVVRFNSTGKTAFSLEKGYTYAIDECLLQHCSIVQDWGVLSCLCCLCGSSTERPSAAVQGRQVQALCTRIALGHSAVLAGAELCL